LREEFLHFASLLGGVYPADSFVVARDPKTFRRDYLLCFNFSIYKFLLFAYSLQRRAGARIREL